MVLNDDLCSSKYIMMFKKTLAFAFIISLLACNSTKNAIDGLDANKHTSGQIQTKSEVYHASREINSALIHTILDVSFDWNKRQLIGMATITLRPHFYPVRSVELDARAMEVKKVWMLEGEQTNAIPYYLANEKLIIDLGREYTRNETYTLKIDYIAKPEELVTKSGTAITSDKGLYFINADGSDLYKPKQIWTQGQSQSSSVWFPTIDAPNQRMTQEVNITIDTSFVTLSNGILQYSSLNPNGTRTDHWKQTKTHTPYLTMMAIGKYAVVKDKWRNMELGYYVEPGYAEHAKEIFKNTPEILEFFSTKLGFDYPWEKLDQVYVRDFVSGAMENTGAIVYGEFVQKTTRELIDGDAEDFVAHEIAHQWFGDLVTCESWSNTTLNEAFATYAEYLWFNHKYGKEEADYHFQKDLTTYLKEANSKQEKLIRYDYEEVDDMFDAHSYQKGSRVLHMLRRVVGEEAFFASVKDYLETNKFGSVELAQLRLSFEKITGKDLNWFFDQWFLSPGHPNLDLSSTYDSLSAKITVDILQKQDTERFPIYKMPLAIDIYNGVTVERKEVFLSKANEVFVFDSKTKPVLVNIDAEKYLLCAKVDRKSNAEWMFQYKNAPLYLDRLEAINALSANYKAGTPEAEFVKNAMNDKHFSIQLAAIKNVSILAEKGDEEVRRSLINLAVSDKKSVVRTAAIKALSAYYKGDDLTTIYKESLQDSSYKVLGAGLTAYVKAERKDGFQKIKYYEDEQSNNLKIAIAGIYAEYGSDENYAYFSKTIPLLNGFDKYYLIRHFANFILICNESNMMDAIKKLEYAGKNDNEFLVRMASVQGLGQLVNKLAEREKEMQKKLSSDNTGVLRTELDSVIRIKKFAEERMNEAIRFEKDEDLKKIYGVMN